MITQAKNVEVSCRCSDVPSNPLNIHHISHEISQKSHGNPRFNRFNSVQPSFSMGFSFNHHLPIFQYIFPDFFPAFFLGTSWPSTQGIVVVLAAPLNCQGQLLPWWGHQGPCKMAIEIADFPMKNGGSFHRFLDMFTRDKYPICEPWCWYIKPTKLCDFYATCW